MGRPLAVVAAAAAPAPRSSRHRDVDAFLHANNFDNDTFRTTEILRAYNQQQIAEFFRNNELAFVTEGSQRGVYTSGVHDFISGVTPYFVTPETLQQKLQHSGLQPQFWLKGGMGR